MCKATPGREAPPGRAGEPRSCHPASNAAGTHPLRAAGTRSLGVLALTWQGHRGRDLCRASVRGRVTPAPSGRKARVLHPHRHAGQCGAVAGSPERVSGTGSDLGNGEWDSSPRVWPNPGSRTTPILGDPDLTRLLVTLGDGPEAPEVPSHLCSSGMRMGWGERGGWPHSQAQRATVPSPSATGRAGGGLGRCFTPQRCFPPRRARSPEREKEKAEGLGKKTPGSVDNINERLSHRDCF